MKETHSKGEKRIAIMQPYFFPYIGYWQLINAVDVFVIYDIGHYIKDGWMHRNRIIRKGTPEYISLPIEHASSNKCIKDIKLATNKKYIFSKQKETISHCYKKAPYYLVIEPMFNKILDFENEYLVAFIKNHLEIVCKYLNISTEFILASELIESEGKDVCEKIYQICEKVGIYNFINPIGGMQFYEKEDFLKHGHVKLSFLQRQCYIEYSQYGNKLGFVPDLSIIDVMMNCSTDEIAKYLEEYMLL